MIVSERVQTLALQIEVAGAGPEDFDERSLAC
jgi:hypothetical protein